MPKLGFTIMAMMAAAVVLASCDTQSHGLFADEPSATSSIQRTMEHAS